MWDRVRPVEAEIKTLIATRRDMLTKDVTTAAALREQSYFAVLPS